MMKRSLLGFGAVLLAAVLPLSAQSPGWTKVATPHVAVYTAGSATTAHEWLIKVEAFRAPVNGLGPADERALDPMIGVVFPDQAAFEEFFLPPEAKKLGRAVITYYMAAQNCDKFGRTFCAMNPTRANLAEASFLLQAGLWGAQTFPRTLPIWLATGLQQICVEGVAHGSQVELGRRSKVNLDVLDGKLVQPLDQLLHHSSFASSDYAEDWVLVHFLLWGDNGANRPALLRFITTWESGHTHDEAIAAAFPEGLEALGHRVAKYLKEDSYRGETVTLTAETVAKIQTETVSEAEVEVVMGYMGAVAGSAIQAQSHLDRAGSLAANPVMLHEAEGFLALTQGNMPDAENAFQRAVAAGSRWYIAHGYRDIAMSRPVLGVDVADGADTTLARRSADALQELMRLNPYYYPSYECYAGLIGALRDVTAGDEEVVKRGRLLFPSGVTAELGWVALMLRHGDQDGARACLEKIRQNSKTLSPNLEIWVHQLELRAHGSDSRRRLQQLYESGQLDQASEALAKIPRESLSPSDLAALQDIEQGIETLRNIQAEIGRKRYGSAAALIDQTLQDNPPAPIRAQLKALSDQIAAAKAQAAKAAP